MSHFSVLLVSDVEPTNAVIETALMPWHEFECTGIDNEYVQAVDKTEDTREQYEKATAKLVQFENGERLSRYEKRFWVRDVGIGSLSNDRFILPDGACEIEVPMREWQGFAEYAAELYGSSIVTSQDQIDLSDKHKYGFVLVQDGKVSVIDRTNPNKKWDWWKIGGRWSGLLASKNGGVKGDAGLAGEQYRDDGVDICRRGDLDLERMKGIRRAEREAMFLEALNSYRKNGKKPLDDSLDLCGLKRRAAEYSMAIAGARPAWEGTGDLPARGAFAEFIEASDNACCQTVRSLRERYGTIFGWYINLPEGTPDADVWIDESPAISCWAVVKDGVWHEKGQMGWFGMSNDNMTEAEWSAQTEDMILSLPDEKWLAVVDCHI